MPSAVLSAANIDCNVSRPTDSSSSGARLGRPSPDSVSCSLRMYAARQLRTYAWL